MSEVTVRELRNKGGEVLDRVLAGEQITVTKHGKPIVDLVIHREPAVPIDVLIEDARHLPPMDYALLRADIDAIMDTRL
ncbi:MAG: type II toxin-antitoxin system prevent-host-death family antitoxin [Lapillicoccus sp.]